MTDTFAMTLDLTPRASPATYCPFAISCRPFSIFHFPLSIAGWQPFRRLRLRETLRAAGLPVSRRRRSVTMVASAAVTPRFAVQRCHDQ
jgi:hypothetical protein